MNAELIMVTAMFVITKFYLLTRKGNKSNIVSVYVVCFPYAIYF